MKLLNIFASSLVLFFLFTPIALAAQQPNCQVIYGGGASCEQDAPVTINKFVLNPESKAYVDSLLPSDPQYKAGENITFKLTLANPTNAAINNIEVSDIFPDYITYLDGPGTYDDLHKILTITVDQLKSKETRDFIIRGVIADNSALPDAQFPRCVINQARATANNKTSQDNAIICIPKDSTAITTTNGGNGAQPQTTSTRGGLTIYPSSKAKTTPPTGPAEWGLFTLAMFGIMGFYLRNKAKT